MALNASYVCVQGLVIKWVVALKDMKGRGGTGGDEIWNTG